MDELYVNGIEMVDDYWYLKSGYTLIRLQKNGGWKIFKPHANDQAEVSNYSIIAMIDYYKSIHGEEV